MAKFSRFQAALTQPQGLGEVNAVAGDNLRPRLYKPIEPPKPRISAPVGMPKHIPMSYFAGLAAGLLAVGILHLWRLLYPVGDPAILLLVVLGLLVWRGTYRRSVIRRMTWRRAILRTDSWLYEIFQGRVMAHLMGFVAALATVVTLADFALTASVREGGLAIGLCLTTGLVLAFAARWAAMHTRRDLVLVVAGPIAATVMGLIGTAAFFWVGWYLEPAPAAADAPNLSAAISQGQSVLPPRDHIVAWAIGLPRSLETAGWVLAKQTQSFAFSPFGLILLLLYNALVSFSLTRLVVDIVTAAYEPKDP
jgi:hypothetical protein